MTLSDLATRAAGEIRDAVAAIEPAALELMVTELAQAKRVVCYGVGREGLMMRALAMRLYHMGLDAHVVGDMTCPPVGPGDLLVVSAGPGSFSTVNGLIGVARAAGARIACVTAQLGETAQRLAFVGPCQHHGAIAIAMKSGSEAGLTRARPSQPPRRKITTNREALDMALAPLAQHEIG